MLELVWEEIAYLTPSSLPSLCLSFFSGTMRKQRQTIKSREALFSIWSLLCEVDKRAALPEADAPGLPCSGRSETSLNLLRWLR